MSTPPDRDSMKREWDARARADLFFAVDGVAETEAELGEEGRSDCETILADVQEHLPREARGLEIGCGIGRVLAPMAVRFAELWGVDVSREMVERGRERLSSLAHVRILENDGRDLAGVPSDHFDFCFSAFAFQHVPDRSVIAGYVREAHRVLRDQGIFKAQVWGLYANNPFRSFYDGLTPDTWDGVRFTMSEIVRVVEEQGFRMMAAYHAPQVPPVRPEGKRQRRLWVVARKAPGVDEYEALALGAGTVLAGTVPAGASVILVEPEMGELIAAAAAVAGRPELTIAHLYPPAEDASAVDALEALRRQGGRYLLLSPHAQWWLETYPELEAHLRARYRRAAEAPSCVVFDLS